MLSGAEELTDCQYNSNSCHHLFCKHCGVHAFGWCDIPQAGGKYDSVTVICLDDLGWGELVAAKARDCDGRNDNEWSEPAEKRHL